VVNFIDENGGGAGVRLLNLRTTPQLFGKGFRRTPSS
jgi:hypothetical protein